MIEDIAHFEVVELAEFLADELNHDAEILEELIVRHLVHIRNARLDREYREQMQND